MKIVLNKCFGGFGLSPKALQRLAELKGVACYFFKLDHKHDTYAPLTMEEATKSMFWVAFTVPNPNDILASQKEWSTMTMEERQAQNKKYGTIELSSHRLDDRTDPILIQVVEELGTVADGSCAQLRIVEIPDGVEWELDVYDGIESVHEVHRSWG
jgi:hypothetical protein